MRTANIRANGEDVEINLAGSATLDAAGGLPWAKPKIKELRGFRPIDIITDLRLTLLRNGYEPVPLVGKKPIFDNWQAVEITETTIKQWAVEHPDWVNTGIRTECMPTLDADISDPGVIPSIRIFLQGWCHNGRMLIRTGRAPRFAVPFRCDVPFSKIKRELRADAKIELLATGQQIVVEGIHPETGRTYIWEGDAAPWNVHRDALPPLDAAMAETLLDELVAKIERDHSGFITKQQPKPDGSGTSNVIYLNDYAPRLHDWKLPTLQQMREAEAQGRSLKLEDNLLPPSIEAIQAALDVVDPDISRSDGWLAIGFALHDQFGGSAFGFKLWDGWSNNGSKYKRREMRGQWKSFGKRNNRSKKASIGTLFYHADQTDPGWRNKVERCRNSGRAEGGSPGARSSTRAEGH